MGQARRLRLENKGEPEWLNKFPNVPNHLKEEVSKGTSLYNMTRKQRRSLNARIKKGLCTQKELDMLFNIANRDYISELSTEDSREGSM